MVEIRIVLIDDHAVVRAGLRNALAELPEVTVVGEAEDGRDVEGVIERFRPDCLLIDVTMPNFEPISAIKRIRLRYPDLKILVVSAFDDDVYVQGLLSAGVNGYHLKDQPLSDLQLAVQRVMRGERWVTGRLVDKLLGGGNETTQQPSATKSRGLGQLTKRQKGILRLLQAGYDNQRIASEIGISIKTVENHLTRLYRILSVQSRLEAVNLARRSNFGEEEPVVRPTVNHGIERSDLMTQGVIMIVDDNGRFRHQLRRTLLKIMPQALVIEAQNSDEAIQKAKQMEPELVFIDVVLGTEDGVQCTRRLRPLLPKSRIILMTAYPDREFRQRGILAGAAALLDKKDLDSTVLRGIVQDVLG